MELTTSILFSQKPANRRCCWVKWVQFMSSNSTKLFRHILILYSYLCLTATSNILQVSYLKFCRHLLYLPPTLHVQCAAISILISGVSWDVACRGVVDVWYFWSNCYIGDINSFPEIFWISTTLRVVTLQNSHRSSCHNGNFKNFTVILHQPTIQHYNEISHAART
jgi:hypothetical protein